MIAWYRRLGPVDRAFITVITLVSVLLLLAWVVGIIHFTWERPSRPDLQPNPMTTVIA